MPKLSTFRHNSAVEFQKRPTILMMLNTSLRCPDVAGVVVHSCKPHFDGSAPFGTTLPSNFTTPNDPDDAKHAFQHAPSLWWSCVTRVRRVSTAQHPSVLLCSQITTTLNDPYDAKHAFQHARALRWSCVTRVSSISTAQHPSVQLCRLFSTGFNEPCDTRHALHML